MESHTLTVDAWAKGASSEIVIKVMSDIVQAAPLMPKPASIFTFQKRCRVGHMRFDTADQMWTALRMVKDYSKNNNLKTNGGSPLWTNPYKTADQRRRGAPIRCAIMVVKSKLSAEQASAMEVCWKGCAVYPENKPILETTKTGAQTWSSEAVQSFLNYSVATIAADVDAQVKSTFAE